MGLDTLEEAVDEYIENTLNKWTHERDTGSVRESRLASWSRDYHLIPLLIINTPGNHISPLLSIQLSFNSIQLFLSSHLWIPAIYIHLHDCKLNPQIAADARDINRYLWFKFHLQRSSRLSFIPVMCCYPTYFLYSSGVWGWNPFMTRDTLTTSCYHPVIPKLHVRIIYQNESVTGPRRIGIESRPENWNFHHN